MCCKQRTCAIRKPRRCNTYKKPGGGCITIEHFSSSQLFRLQSPGPVWHAANLHALCRKNDKSERLVSRGLNEWSRAGASVAWSIELSNASFPGIALPRLPCRECARPGAPRTRTQQRLRRTARQTGRAGRRADHPLGIRRPRGSFPDLHFCAGRKFLLSHRPQRRRRRTLDSSRGQRRLGGRTARNFVSSREESRKRKMERCPNVSVGSRHRSAYRICYGKTIRQRLPLYGRKSCKNVSGFLHDSSLSEGTRRLSPRKGRCRLAAARRAAGQTERHSRTDRRPAADQVSRPDLLPQGSDRFFPAFPPPTPS